MAETTTALAIQQVQGTPLDVLERQIAAGELSDELDALLGAELAAEVEEMTRTPGPIAQAAEDRPIVVVLPGITGSLLANTAGDVGMIWVNPLALAFGKLALLMLDRRGVRDASPGVKIVASGLIPTHYLAIQLHLRILAGCEVLGFPYDWRRTPDSAVDSLRRLVMGIFRERKRKVHLVGHSMGGLVARNFCLRYPDDAARAVEQIIQLGTPNYGSYEAVRNLTIGGDTVRLALRLNPANIPLPVMRSCPGLYAMAPAPAELFPVDAPDPYPFSGDFQVYDALAYGSADVSEAHLKATRESYRWLSTAPDLPVPATVIAGFGVPTCVQVLSRADADGPAFAVSNDGDGTVPGASVTALPGVTRLYGRGLDHGGMPLNGTVRGAVANLVRGRRPEGLHASPAEALQSAEPAAESAVPPPGAVAELEFDAAAARLSTGRGTPADLQLLLAMR